MDVHSADRRSYNMSRIKSSNTKPEVMLRRLLWHRGYRYILHVSWLPGKPDIVFRKKKKVIFVHGCFWHRHDCRFFKWPQSNETFWKRKIEGNVQRDTQVNQRLVELGWGYLIIWECEIKKNQQSKLLDKVETFLNL